MLNIVLFNGGRGASTIINSLKKQNNISITSIINAYDDGKSTGEIRRVFDMLGPSDIRKVQSLFLNSNNEYFKSNTEVFNFRFLTNANYSASTDLIKNFIDNDNNFLKYKLNKKISKKIKIYLSFFLKELGSKNNTNKFNFSDCSLMNCIYAGAYSYYNRNLLKTIYEINKLFEIRSQIFPNSVDNKILVGIQKNGHILYSESEIVNLRSNVIIDNIYLLDQTLDKAKFNKLDLNKKNQYLKIKNNYPSILPQTKKVIKNADIIIYCPGTQHSSLYPTYLTNGIGDEIYKNKNCLKFFITNIGADYESPVYIASEYVLNAVKYLNYSSVKNYLPQDLIDYVFVNNNKNNTLVNRVIFDKKKLDNIGLKYFAKNFEKNKSKGSHDGKKISNLIMKIINNL